MSDSIPERLDLGQLRRQAKELRDAARRADTGAAERIARHHRGTLQGAVTLAVAQLVIAREQGFPSWPKLKAAIDANASAGRAIEELLAASVEGRMRQAASIVRANQGIAGQSLRAAAVLGDVLAAQEMLTADPAAAAAIDDDRGWPPLLYACYSRWHQADPSRAPAIAEVACLLLRAGASPNTNNGARTGYRSALTGSVEVNNPEVTKVLLEAGANPDDRETIGWAAFSGYHQCLELLLSHGARVAGTWAIAGAVDADDARVVSLLLGELQRSTGQAAQKATELLPEAAANASLQVVDALLDSGADPGISDEDGVSALRRAIRAGKDDTAARLRGLGVPDDATDVDIFIGACLNADRDRAERLLAGHLDCATCSMTRTAP
jgi:ankyrin repeat protein